VQQHLAPSTLSSSRADGTSFNWRAYLHNYPELLLSPTSLSFTEDDARRHWYTTGRAQGRVATWLTLRLRYTTAGGLTNQLLAHLPAFMIAREVGADVVVAPVVSRSGFTRGNKEWRMESAETLFDLDKMQAFWRDQGLVVHKVRMRPQGPAL
jgi:hypothetical protein